MSLTQKTQAPPIEYQQRSPGSAPQLGNLWARYFQIPGTLTNQVFSYKVTTTKHSIIINRLHRILRSVEWLTVLLCILNVPGSNLGPETGYPDWFFLWLSPVPTGKCSDSRAKLRHENFLPYTFQFIIYLLPFHSMLHSLKFLKIPRKINTHQPQNVRATRWEPLFYDQETPRFKRNQDSRLCPAHERDKWQKMWI
jgi:hypothetical protein